MLNHDSLLNHYEVNFELVQHWHYSLSEIENMMPFERQYFIELLNKYLREKAEQQDQEAARARAKQNG